MTDRAVTYEFHVTRAARERYGFDESWFALTGNVVLADFATTRRLAYRMNQVRDAVRHPERAIHAGQLHAMGLIDEILHYVASLYRRQIRADVLERALERLDAKLGHEHVDAALRRFTQDFPPLDVHRGKLDAAQYLAGRTAGTSHRVVALEELLLMWLANMNPAFAPYRELFDDVSLSETGYAAIIRDLAGFFAGQPPFGPDDQSLVDMLRSPAIASPHSLWGQLDYIRARWGYLLGDFLDRLRVTLDVIDEEERAGFLRFAGWTDTPRGQVLDFRAFEAETERFSADRDWMPRVVLIAKSTYVWLDQLARQYQRQVGRLDQIPDDELDKLARWGVTGLWLIGVWERSTASRRIKQLCGNPDALASAYSLYDYRIAEDLGGEEAYRALRERAARRGIRLASDMVPNHMGIDSRWMIEHPDWFLSLDHSPYPAYSFHGPDLSYDSRVALRIEDHYYDRTDAAVVFQRVDRGSGETRWVYHGNDGTFMPWNDTAQLDFLKPEVREGVIQTILHVARQFPIIRFDAAMTLAKRHFQRLWYPEPGSGGAIPSRAERGLTRDAFNEKIPVEFWREVVDRVAAEVPDTLLLAEAFWLMEGYFVRTLGMHRVYNSAFMNMLRDEENANYRSVIKNTLEFDPEILKRYVNFMNNPDERTAADQFGKGDKYFGVCTMMVTLPGLPMLGHGQVEGFTERYGMEFRRAAWDETPEGWLIERHEREIFPLLHRRRVFAEARDFLLYDFYNVDGTVNEDVFAYSNRDGDDRSLVLYHNRYASAQGWIRLSAAAAVKTGHGDEKALRQRTLGEGLGLAAGPDHFCVFRDHRAGLDYVRAARDLSERGLYAELDAYRCQVFLDFREVQSTADQPWADVARELGGRGVPSADEKLREIRLRPVVEPFREVMDPELWRALLEPVSPTAASRARGAATRAPEADAAAIVGQRLPALIEKLARAVRSHLRLAGEGEGWGAPGRLLALQKLAEPAADGRPDAARRRRARAALHGWALIHGIGGLAGAEDATTRTREWLRAWSWDRVFTDCFQRLGFDASDAAHTTDLIEAIAGHVGGLQAAAREPSRLSEVLDGWWADDVVRRALGANQFQGTWWIRKESLEELLTLLVAASEVLAPPSGREEAAKRGRAVAERVMHAAEAGGYRLEALTGAVRG
jgi:glycosidase